MFTQDRRSGPLINTVLSLKSLPAVNDSVVSSNSFQKKKWKQIHNLAGCLEHIFCILFAVPMKPRHTTGKLSSSSTVQKPLPPWMQDGFSFRKLTARKQSSWTVPNQRTFILSQVPESQHSSIWMMVKFRYRRNNSDFQQIYLLNNEPKLLQCWYII